jgi:iron complex transport system substrate-binding protein
VIKSLSLSRICRFIAILFSGLLLGNLSMIARAEAPSSVQPANKPQRIVSLSLCTDQVLLMLVEPERIASVSNLASDPVYSYMWQQAQGLRQHSGLAEEIVPLKPDLIIGSIYSRGNTHQMLNQLGMPVSQFSSPVTLSEVETFTRSIAEAVGETERAERVIKQMHAEIAKAQALIKDLDAEVAISYGPNGFTAGKKTLKNEVFELAGYQNLAANLGIEYYGNLSVEQLLAAKPDVIVIDEAIPNQDSLAQAYVNHPVLQRLFKGKKMPSVATKYWICPGPSVSQAVLSLAQQRLNVSNHFLSAHAKPSKHQQE